MAYSALEVARHIINLADDNNLEMSNLRLQKLLYFIQAYFLVDSNCTKKCFDDKIEAWNLGPVVPNVYKEFKEFGSYNIPRVDYYYENDSILWNATKHFYYDNIIKNDDKKKIDRVVLEFSRFSSSEMVEITHQQEPWKNAYIEGRNVEITVDKMGDYFCNGK